MTCEELRRTLVEMDPRNADRATRLAFYEHYGACKECREYCKAAEGPTKVLTKADKISLLRLAATDVTLGPTVLSCKELRRIVTSHRPRDVDRDTRLAIVDHCSTCAMCRKYLDRMPMATESEYDEIDRLALEDAKYRWGNIDELLGDA